MIEIEFDKHPDKDVINSQKWPVNYKIKLTENMGDGTRAAGIAFNPGSILRKPYFNLELDKETATILMNNNGVHPNRGFGDFNDLDENGIPKWKPYTLGRVLLEEFHHAAQHTENGGPPNPLPDLTPELRERLEMDALNFTNKHDPDNVRRGTGEYRYLIPKPVSPSNGTSSYKIEGLPAMTTRLLTDTMSGLNEFDKRFGTSATGFTIDTSTVNQGVHLDLRTDKVTLSMPESFYNGVTGLTNEGLGFQGTDGRVHPITKSRLIATLDVYAYLLDNDHTLKASVINNGGVLPESLHGQALAFVNGLGIGPEWDMSSPTPVALPENWTLEEYNNPSSTTGGCYQYATGTGGIPLYICEVAGGL